MLVMRPDSTIPIARMISSKLNLPEIPLKLYYSQAVYRQEDTLKGRKNEIRQMGIENIGMRDTNTDVDVLQLAAQAIENAGVKNECDEVIDRPHTGCRSELHLEQMTRYV